MSSHARQDFASVDRQDLLHDDVLILAECDLEERVRVMLKKEVEYLPNPNYIAEVQCDGMRPLWRRRVTEWLLEFQEEFGISQDTVAVAVNYMDRYLSKKSTEKEIVQLLAMGSIFVAAKLHETYSIGMKELQALADEVYLASDIKLMELELLGVIQWNLNPITPQLIMNHLVYYIPNAQQRQTLREHAEAFLDVTLCEYHFLHCLPSEQGAAALLCAFESTQISPIAWSEAVSKYDFVRSQRVKDCVDKMREVFARSFTDAFRKDSTSPVGVEDFPDDVDMLMADYHNQPTASSASALQQQQQHHTAGKPSNHIYQDHTTASSASQVRYLGPDEHPNSGASMVVSEPVALYDGKSTHACSSRLAAMHLNSNSGNNNNFSAHCDDGSGQDDAGSAAPLAVIGHCKEDVALDVELKPLPMYHPEFGTSGVVAQR